MCTAVGVHVRNAPVHARMHGTAAGAYLQQLARLHVPESRRGYCEKCLMLVIKKMPAQPVQTTPGQQCNAFPHAHARCAYMHGCTRP